MPAQVTPPPSRDWRSRLGTSLPFGEGLIALAILGYVLSVIAP